MSINQQQAEFIQSLEGDLTPEQSAQLLELGRQGDTGANASEQGNAPSVAGAAPESTANDESAANDDKAENEGQAGNTPVNPESNPANTVILAKDGKHTIGYEKLVEARDDARAWKQQAEEAQRQLASALAAAQTRNEAGHEPTANDANAEAASAAIDKGVDPAIFGDFTDEAIAKGIAKLIDQKSGEILAQVEAKLAPYQQVQQASAQETHNQEIFAKHPDASSIAQSKELDTWVKAQPTFVQGAYAAVLEKGTAGQVIELFDRFKAATGATAKPTSALSRADVAAAAAAAIAKASDPIPVSLSDFHGGRAGAVATQFEAWRNLDGPALLNALRDANASPEQIERFVNQRA